MLQLWPAPKLISICKFWSVSPLRTLPCNKLGLALYNASLGGPVSMHSGMADLGSDRKSRMGQFVMMTSAAVRCSVIIPSWNGQGSSCSRWNPQCYRSAHVQAGALSSAFRIMRVDSHAGVALRRQAAHLARLGSRAVAAELARHRQAAAGLPRPAPLLLAGPAAPRDGPTACSATAGLSSILAARGAPFRRPS